jgi:hypothetical protein
LSGFQGTKTILWTSIKKVEQIKLWILYRDILKNKKITACEAAIMLRISFESAQSILKDNLNMHNTIAKFTPCLMSDGLKVNRVSTCQDLQDRSERDPGLLLTTMKSDETWV